MGHITLSASFHIAKRQSMSVYALYAIDELYTLYIIDELAFAKLFE